MNCFTGNSFTRAGDFDALTGDFKFVSNFGLASLFSFVIYRSCCFKAYLCLNYSNFFIFNELFSSKSKHTALRSSSFYPIGTSYLVSSDTLPNESTPHVFLGAYFALESLSNSSKNSSSSCSLAPNLDVSYSFYSSNLLPPRLTIYRSWEGSISSQNLPSSDSNSSSLYAGSISSAGLVSALNSCAFISGWSSFLRCSSFPISFFFSCC